MHEPPPAGQASESAPPADKTSSSATVNCRRPVDPQADAGGTVDFTSGSEVHLARPRPTVTTLIDVPGYETLQVLGRGGMGVVYLARQVRLKRLVALKM